VPKSKVEKRERTVWTTEYKEELRDVTTMKLVTEKLERSYQICVPTTEVRKVKQTIATPVVTQEKRTATYVVNKCVPEVQMRTVTCYQRQMVTMPCCNPCGGTVSVCQTVPVTTQVPVTVNRMVSETVTRDYLVNVVNYKTEEREVDVTVYGTKMETRKEMVDVSSYKPVTEKVKVQVGSPKSTVEKYDVTVWYNEIETRKEMVDVVEYKTVTEKVKRPVTRWTTVTEVVTETVPVRVCVPLPPCVPCP
jgi:hypothetical protein